MAGSSSHPPGEKRPRIESNSSKHLMGYRRSWEKEFSWLVAVESDGTVTGMMCTLCKRHKTKNRYNQSTVWSSTPCTYFRKDSVGRHAVMLMLTIIKEYFLNDVRNDFQASVIKISRGASVLPPPPSPPPSPRTNTALLFFSAETPAPHVYPPVRSVITMASSKVLHAITFDPYISRKIHTLKTFNLSYILGRHYC